MSASHADSAETALVRRRYDRVAPIYDIMQWGMERRTMAWRQALWRDLEGERVLEVGVGTGQNFRFYTPDRKFTAIDIAPAMLTRAAKRAARMGIDVDLELADAQALPYEDATFDSVVATFLLCSVPDPILGLQELNRVLVPGGKLLLIEHVLSERRLLRRLMQWLDPLTSRLWGAHIDRETVQNVERAGFLEVRDENLVLDVVKRIEGRRARSHSQSGLMTTE